MFIRTFTAEDMPAALQKVKQTLGPDALILSTRTLRKKGLGMLTKPLIEVTAAIESPAMADPHAEPKPQPKAASAPVAKKAAEAYRAVNLSDQARAERRTQPVVDARDMELSELREKVAEQNVSQMQRELTELKALVQQLAENRGQEPSRTEPVSAAPQVEARSAPRSAITAELLARGIDADAAKKIARFAESRMTDEQRTDPELQHQFLCEIIAGLIQVCPPIWGDSGQGQRRIALVGPTGVGKTTTIAKLAAAAVAAGLRVALVTIDTFRIAAVEQLKIYGEIMNLPVEVIFRPEQLPQILGQHRDKDLILIDTAGRSPRDRGRIDELANFFGPNSGIESWLVLAAHSREEQLRQVVENFSRLPLTNLVFTKLDECESWGSLLRLPTSTALPLACLTNGQQVPEDLLWAEPQLVAGWIMGSEPQVQKDVV